MTPTLHFEPSRRLDGIGEYYFSRRLREIAELEARTGRSIIRLAMGSPDLPPAPQVIERLATEAHRPDVHKYTAYEGDPILRRAFAEWYRRYYAVDLEWKSEVLPLIGSKEGIVYLAMTYLNPGDRVLVPDPGYPTYAAGIRLAGGVPVTYALNEANDFLPDMEALERAAREGVRMMLCNYPNMPTGRRPTRALFRSLVDLARRYGILLVHDNPYSFIRNGDERLSILSVDGAMDVAVELNSLSKGHSMAGWRVGALMGRAERLQPVLTFLSNIETGIFYPIQAAAAEALSLGEAWYEQLNAIYRAREKQGCALLDALGCTYRPEQAGLFLWGRIPEAFEGDCYAFSDRVMERSDVFLTPGGIFGSEGERYVRITLCCPEQTLAQATRQVAAHPPL